MNLWQERSVLMFGEEAINKLSQANVLVVGVGGVGAYAAEMLVRAGAQISALSEPYLESEQVAVGRTFK